MSIARIAQAANVSYATAWRIINNHPCSSEQAVSAVKQAMRQLGYEPAVGRRRGRPAKGSDGIRTHNIALLHFREGTSISTSVLSSVQRTLAERNLNLVFAHVDGAESLPQAVRTGNIDGILGYGQFPADAITPRLEKVPAVWMMSRSDANLDPWGDRVRPDHLAIGQMAASHLLARGHTHIAFLNPDANFRVYQQRLQGFVAQAPPPGASISTFQTAGNHDLETAAEALVDQWLAASPRPTGLFVPVDRVTLRVYRHLLRKGIHPGPDVQIISCDNETDLLTLMTPAPASIDLNRQTIARLAVERLFWRMRNGVTSPRVVVTVSPTLADPPA